MSVFVKFAENETENSSVILIESNCKFFIDESNSCIMTYKLALSIIQSDRNCKLEI